MPDPLVTLVVASGLLWIGGGLLAMYLSHRSGYRAGFDDGRQDAIDEVNEAFYKQYEQTWALAQAEAQESSRRLKGVAPHAYKPGDDQDCRYEDDYTGGD